VTDDAPSSITCPRCGRTSHNPNDVREGYCGACHDWTTTPLPGIDSPGRDALADEMRRALDEEMRYDDDDWTRLADAALRWFAGRAPSGRGDDVSTTTTEAGS
jgi:hypothetical protein